MQNTKLRCTKNFTILLNLNSVQLYLTKKTFSGWIHHGQVITRTSTDQEVKWSPLRQLQNGDNREL